MQVVYTVAHPSAIPEIFMPVAKVTLELGEDQHPRDLLEQVFELTNTVESPWCENPEVHMLMDPRRARSTSVGDRISCTLSTPSGNLFYLWEVDRAGYRDLKEAGIWK